MAWTTPTVRSTGYLVTAVVWNADLVANLIELRAGGLAISGQAANRIPYASSSTQLATSASLTFDGTNLTVGGVVTGTDLTLTQSGASDVATIQGTRTDAQLAILGGTAGGKIQLFGSTYTNFAGALYLDTSATGGGTNDSCIVFRPQATERMRLHASGGLSVGDATDPGATNLRVAGTVKAVGQPGFLAFNAAQDTTQANAATIDFDTEVYDELGNFASDTFTAPVAGRYLFCVVVQTGTGSATQDRGISLVTSNRTYFLDYSGALATGSAEVLSGSVIADMDANDTASVSLVLSTGTCTILGDVTSLITSFSGRLLP